MVIDRGSSVPVYAQLAALLRRDIARGVLPAGAALPTERMLCQVHGLGRDAVREALAVLRGEGLITTRRGFPSVVRCAPGRRFVPLQAGDRALARMPSPAEARRLGLAVGVPVWEIHRPARPSRLVAADQYGLRGSPCDPQRAATPRRRWTTRRQG